MNKRDYKDTLIYKASKLGRLIFLSAISAVFSVFLFCLNPDFDGIMYAVLFAILAIAFAIITVYSKISWSKLENLYKNAEIQHTDNFSLEPLPYINRRRLVHVFSPNSRLCVKIEGKRYYSKHHFNHSEFEDEISRNKHLYFFLCGDTLYPLWFDYAEIE